MHAGRGFPRVSPNLIKTEFLDEDFGSDINPAEIDALFKPLIDWSNNITTLDYQTVIVAVVPDWLITLQQFFQSVGINVSIPNIVAALLQPFVQPIKDAIRAYVIDQAKTFIGDLADKYKMQLDAVTASYDARLKTYAGVGLNGTMLDHFYESGLFGHSFNISAVTLANHGIALPVGESQGGNGPASFDASHTPSWMQPALCEYMREAVFPLGTTVKAQLSVRSDKDYPAQINEDSPIECHDGSLMMFTAMPGPMSCELVDTKELVDDSGHKGSPTRAYPPNYAAEPPTCQNLKVEGLPEPPTLAEPTGCGCRVGEGAPASNQMALAFGVLAGAGLLLVRRRRQALRRGVMLAVLLGLGLPAIGCGPGEMTNENPDMMISPTSPKGMFLASLKDSVWQGMQTRSGKMRAIELRFDTASLLWAETRNPFGPARRRELRAFTVDDDAATVHSTVITPTDWKDPDKQIGRKDDFTITVNAGTPRTLTVVKKGSPDVTETYTEGAFAAPTDGLTATVRVFPASGVVDDAFCVSGGAFDYSVFFDFARGRSAEPLLGSDFMAGAKLNKWRDASGQNRFAVSDIPSFSNFGGTELSDQANFFVHYQGIINHPGGAFQMRENNDSVEDGLWVFLNSDVGTNQTNRVFLEVQGFNLIPDLTADAPSVNLPAGPVPIEIITVRCAKQIEDQDIEVKMGSGNYQLVGNAPTSSTINDTLFPPAL